MCDGVRIDAVDEFKYLGTLLNSKNKIEDEINSRIIAGNKAYFANSKVMKSKLISRKAKLKLYKTLIRPVVTYGAEAWTMAMRDENALRVFERKIMRRIMGPVRTEEGWRTRRNEEISHFMGEDDIVRFIKAQRIRWLGHVVRMEQGRLPGSLLRGEMIGIRKRGRPRKRWLDDVEEDLRVLGVRRWRGEAGDRERWRRIVQEAKVHLGL